MGSVEVPLGTSILISAPSLRLKASSGQLHPPAAPNSHRFRGQTLKFRGAQKTGPISGYMRASDFLLWDPPRTPGLDQTARMLPSRQLSHASL